MRRTRKKYVPFLLRTEEQHRYRQWMRRRCPRRRREPFPARGPTQGKTKPTSECTEWLASWLASGRFLRFGCHGKPFPTLPSDCRSC